GRAAGMTRRRKLTPLTSTDSFTSFVVDQLSELGEVTPRSMFGGVGLYHRGVFFGLIGRDVLYLKVDDSNRGDYERAGMRAFQPSPDRRGTMHYYAVPLDVLESGLELTTGARKAVAVAERAARDATRRRRPPARRGRQRRTG